MRAIRFIHTSDVHLDTSFSGAGLPSRLGDRKREAIRSTFRRILEDARTQGVDLVLIAGDLFEIERVTPDTVEFLRQLFASLGTLRVFIAPGNHDPYLPGSPYREEPWPANVHVFQAEEFHSVDLPELGVRVTGFGFNRSQFAEGYFRRLPALPKDAWNLVLAHGSDVARVPSGKTAHGPLTIAEIAGKNVLYCALGHYHQQRPVENPIDSTQVWYAGVPEGRGWDEEGEGAYLLGEIRDGAVNVSRVPCSQYPFKTIGVDCEGFSSREQIVEAILLHRGTAFDPRTILRVRLEGCPDPRLDLSLPEISERLAEEVLHLELDDRTVPAIDFESLAREDTLPGLFVREMDQRLAAASSEERDLLGLARLYGAQALLDREVRLR
jgi:DNA repair exonuclease SbcCD nuclease subunit